MKEHLRRIIVGASVTATVLFALLMIVARFFGLQETLIYDEVYSWVTANPAIPFSTVWHDILLQDVNLPLFNLVLRVWAHIVPFTEVWLRVLPMIFSLAAIAVAWFLAPRRWSKLERLALCSLLAASMGLTNYSDVIRSYSMGVFFTVIFNLLALRILDAFTNGEDIPKSWWWGFFSAGLVAAYTHFFACGIFFITCLFLFFYACAYKRARALVFWATALCFFLWVPWLYNTYSSLGHFSSGWWYETNKVLSSWQILEYCLGSEGALVGLMLFTIVGLVSVFCNEKDILKKYLGIILPLFQLVMLVAVLLALSKRYNLFMNRYFLMTLPSVFILLVSLWIHLYKRWLWIVALLPLFLYFNTIYYFHNSLPLLTEYSGLTASFEYAAEALHAPKVLVLMDPITYPGASQWPIMRYFIPKDYPAEVLPLTKENAEQVGPSERVPLVVPLCSFYRVVMASVDYGYALPEKLVSFRHSCVVHHSK